MRRILPAAQLAMLTGVLLAQAAPADAQTSAANPAGCRHASPQPHRSITLPRLSGQPSSPSHVLEEYAFNSAGVPLASLSPESASHRLQLAAIGDDLAMLGLVADGFGLDAALTAAYRPPEEVQNLRLGAKKNRLFWDPSLAAGSYTLYRQSLKELTEPTVGDCNQPGIETPFTTDNDPVPVGGGFFYLVTVDSRLGERGPAGTTSDGTPRPMPPACP